MKKLISFFLVLVCTCSFTMLSFAETSSKIKIEELSDEEMFAMVKEVFSDRIDSFSHSFDIKPSVKNNIFNTKSIVFNETRAIDEDNQCFLIEYNDGTSVYGMYSKAWLNASSSTGSGYSSFSGTLRIGVVGSAYYMYVANFAYTLINEGYDQITNVGMGSYNASAFSPISYHLQETAVNIAYVDYGCYFDMIQPVGGVTIPPFYVSVRIQVGNDQCIVLCNGVAV